MILLVKQSKQYQTHLRIILELCHKEAGDLNLQCKNIVFQERKRAILYLSQPKSFQTQNNSSSSFRMRITPMRCMWRLFLCEQTCNIWFPKTLSKSSMSKMLTKTNLRNKIVPVVSFKVATLSIHQPIYWSVKLYHPIIKQWMKRYRLKKISKTKRLVKVTTTILSSIMKNALLTMLAREICSSSKTKRNIESYLTWTISVKMGAKQTYSKLQIWVSMIFLRITELARSSFISISLIWLSPSRTRSSTTSKNQLLFCKLKK